MGADEQRAAEEQRPEWLPDKFTSPEELARSYSEAEQRLVAQQAEIDRQRQEFNEALVNIQQMQEMQQAQQQPRYDPSQDPLLQQYQSAVDTGDAQAMLAIQLELNRQIVNQAVSQQMQEMGGRIDRSTDADREMAITLATERVARNYDNWDDLAPRIGEFLQSRPNWIPDQPSVEAFERAIVEAARVITADDILAERQREEQGRTQKLAAQGLTGQGIGGPLEPQQDQVAWDRIKQIDLGGYSGIMRGAR